MEGEEHQNVLPILQNHEQRLTTVEVSMASLRGEFKEVKDELKDDLKDVKDIINKGNEDAKNQLDDFNEQIRGEFFKKKQSSHEYKWSVILKVVGGLVGGLSFFYVLIDKIIGGIL